MTAAKRTRKPCVPVIGPSGEKYPSISAAAFAVGKTPAAIWTSVHLRRGGWRIDLEADPQLADRIQQRHLGAS